MYTSKKVWDCASISMKRWGGGGEGLYKLYRYLPPQRVWFLSRFGLKTGIEFVHFGLDRVWFSRELRECINLFFISVPNE